MNAIPSVLVGKKILKPMQAERKKEKDINMEVQVESKIC